MKRTLNRLIILVAVLTVTALPAAAWARQLRPLRPRRCWMREQRMAISCAIPLVYAGAAERWDYRRRPRADQPCRGGRLPALVPKLRLGNA